MPEYRRRQRGQALIYGMFVTVGAAVALFFLFDAGQLSREKTKLVNTGDAVAYSAGVMHARTLNYEAYLNRAMLANTVAIAQLVSLSSWVQHAGNMATYGWALDNPKFAPYYPAYFAALASGSYLQASLNDAGSLEATAAASDRLIRNVLMTAQQAAHAGLIPARQQVMEEVARANYRNDGSVSVDLMPLTGNQFPSVLSRYSGDRRTRFAEIARVAANRDPFVPKRSWMMPAMWADCAGAFSTGRVDWLDRRGGTELIGFDEWKAMDTLSEKRWTPKSKTDALCLAIVEQPAAWGAGDAADAPGLDVDPTHYDYAWPINPAASLSSQLTSSAWGYSGLPNFYDLSESALAEADPRLRFAVRLRRHKGQTLTSEGRSQIRSSGSGTRLGKTLNDYRAEPAGGDDLVAVSTSEVFFERSADARDNAYGRESGKPREIGSLFNPFWQVHLIQADDILHAARALQGAVLP